MRLIIAIILAAALAMCGCLVRVVDPSGKPIEGARLGAVATAPGGTTDANGEGTFPAEVKGWSTMVRVSRPGYETQIADRHGPIVLQPATRP
jgi:hypothetical protein